MTIARREPSVASSMTLGRPSMTPNSALHKVGLRATANSDDVDMPDATDPPKKASLYERFIIAVDFGTTCSLVSFVGLFVGEVIDRYSLDRNFLDRIQSIDRWPNDPTYRGERRKEVPSETWYSKGTGFEEQDLSENVENPGKRPISDRKEGVSEEGVFDALCRADKYGENDVAKDFLWGYSVWNAAAYSHEHNRRVSRFKLLLEESELTAGIRNNVRGILKELSKRKVIKEDEDVITDYLTSVFRHTKGQLEEKHSFSDNHPVEFVLCVPTIWSPRSCRKMHAAMAKAMLRAGFATLGSGDVDNLFIVSEPEAAAALVLATTDDIKPNDIFLLIDAGGGTVDATIYAVDQRYPLRLREEVVEPAGAQCGSSYINEKCQESSYENLKDETYLENPDDHVTIAGIIERYIMKDFENCYKRQVDFTRPNICKQTFHIPGLRPNEEKGFRKNEFRLFYNDFKEMFRPSLTGVASLMKDQLNQARQKQLDVQKKVILIGGFADSPALVVYLKKELEQISKAFGSEIQLIRPSIPGTCGTAVASGAVLRALDKEGGPARAIRSSYGVLRKEPYEPDAHPAHKEARPTRDRLDDDLYIKDTIDWVIKKGNIVPAITQFVVPASHTFVTKVSRKFLCKEILYVSDNSTESHYSRKHPKNEGCEIAGTIVVDMTFLRDEGHIKPIVPADLGFMGNPHYKVEFEIVIEVQDRNMRYSARWPRGDDGRVLDGSQGQISIAAAFQPGTR